ncbi:unnamed protein product [Paramecium sonneborni]|uniref:Uncharacterized protein n=1 Tax=Paramecium sonneborni TaxID=65129 RepID=A0A8S1R016_9CILI|nr:unnamed protein product [Paramecium sonneborni]
MFCQHFSLKKIQIGQHLTIDWYEGNTKETMIKEEMRNGWENEIIQNNDLHIITIEIIAFKVLNSNDKLKVNKRILGLNMKCKEYFKKQMKKNDIIQGKIVQQSIVKLNLKFVRNQKWNFTILKKLDIERLNKMD